jgi:hypothetical protein
MRKAKNKNKTNGQNRWFILNFLKDVVRSKWSSYFKIVEGTWPCTVTGSYENEAGKEAFNRVEKNAILRNEIMLRTYLLYKELLHDIISS